MIPSDKDWNDGWNSGYDAALLDAATTVEHYAEERLVKTEHPNRSEDITAALRVAAERVTYMRRKP